MNNLIDNAIKYSDEGSDIEISTENDEKYIKVMVADSGSGISEEDQDHIFLVDFIELHRPELLIIKGVG